MSKSQAIAAKQKGDKLIVDTSSFFGLIGSSPDYILASEEYSKAANMFRNLNEFDQAADCYIKASECNKQLGSFYLAAKALETAGGVISKSNAEKAAMLYKQAGELYNLSNNPDKSCEILEKAAQTEPDFQKALEYYLEALALYESEDRTRFGLETFKRCISFCCKHAKFKNAIQVSQRLEEALQKMKNSSMYHRQVLSSILIQLSQGEFLDAEMKWSKACGRYIELTRLSIENSEEGTICVELLQAFENGDQEEFNRVLSAHLINYLDFEIIKLARAIVVPTIQIKSEQLLNLQDEIEEEGYL